MTKKKGRRPICTQKDIRAEWTPGSAAEQNLSDESDTGARLGRHKVNKHGDITDFHRRTRYRNETRTD